MPDTAWLRGMNCRCTQIIIATKIGRIVGRITLAAISASSAVVTGMRHIGGFGGWINLAVITATSMLVTRNNAIDWPGDG